MSSEETSAQTQQTQNLPYIVAIGASAGGLEAIERFFESMPADSDMAFVVIQHLSPDYKSLMAEILGKKTRMPAQRVEHGVQVQANTIYLIPPKKNMVIFHGRLLLTEKDTQHAHGLNLPIDIFFRSLAEDQKEKAIGIVLSGTGSDGTRGIRAIKEEGRPLPGIPQFAGDGGFCAPESGQRPALYPH